jgi:hypothetical protein
MIVQLPGGYYDDSGHRHRDVELVPLRGREEELLAALDVPPPELVTRVLASCVQRVGAVDLTAEDVFRRLTVGDRLFLLLKLREATFGSRVTAVASCPWLGCAEKVDIAFRIADIPLRESGPGGPLYDVQLSAEAAPRDTPPDRVVRFRLPNGADQEALTVLLDGNPAVALRTLLESCLVAIGTHTPPGPSRVAALSPRARSEIEAAMAAEAPGPALVMDASCPSCGRGFALPFDIQELFFGEVAGSTDQLSRQVHYLAYHYHWSEAEILDLPREKRLRYLEVLAEEIERHNNALG